MNKKIYALILAVMLILSMNAFAGEQPKSCDKSDAKQCELKDSCCKKDESCDHAKCEKACEKKCEKKKTA